MSRSVRRSAGARVAILLGLYVAFALFTFACLKGSGSESNRRGRWVMPAALGVVTGPFTGAIARHLQSCRVQAGLTLLPYCATLLATGVLFPFVPIPDPRFERTVRLALWCLGLLGWFGGAGVSFGRALS